MTDASEARRFRLLLGVCVAARFALFSVYQPWRPEVEKTSLVYSDPAAYQATALNILNRGVYSMGSAPDSPPDNEWPPGFPFFVAGVYGIGGVRPWLVVLAQILLDLGVVAALYGSTRQVAGQSAATASAALYAVSPDAMVNTQQFRPELLFLLALGLFAFCWFRFLAVCRSPDALTRGDPSAAGCDLPAGHDFRRGVWLWPAGVLLGVATLCKPIAQYLPAVVCLLLVVHAACRYRIRLLVAGLLVFIVSYGVTVAPWYLRNRRVLGTWQVTSMEGRSLLDYAAANVLARSRGLDLDTARAALHSVVTQRYDVVNPPAGFRAGVPGGAPELASSLVRAGYAAAGPARVPVSTPAELSRAEKEVFVQFVKRNAWAYARHSVAAMLRLVFCPPWQELMRMTMPGVPETDVAAAVVRMDLGAMSRIGLGRVSVAASMAAILSLYSLLMPCCAIVGLWRFARERVGRSVVLTVVLFPAYFLALIGPQGESRYRLFLLPFMLPLAGAGWSWIARAAGRTGGRDFGQE